MVRFESMGSRNCENPLPIKSKMADGPQFFKNI